MSRFVALPLLLAFGTCLAGCGAVQPLHLDDPNEFIGVAPRAADVVRSLKCEIITFLVNNRIRAFLKQSVQPSNIIDFYRRYPIFDADPAQYLSLSVDLKNVNAVTLQVGYDWKKPSFDPKTLVLKSADYKDWHLGPSYAETDTFDLLQQYVIQQDADLGPNDSYVGKDVKTPPVAKYTSIYKGQIESDQNFYCYSSLVNSQSSSIEQVVNDIGSIMDGSNGFDKFSNFTRIYVGSSQRTLARWLQDTAGQMSLGQYTNAPTAEIIYSGQLSYAFTLDVKPGIDLKYSLVAGFTNPIIPEAIASQDHTGAFTIYLNAVNAPVSYAAKTGGACNNSDRTAALSKACNDTKYHPPGAQKKG